MDVAKQPKALIYSVLLTKPSCNGIWTHPQQQTQLVWWMSLHKVSGKGAVDLWLERFHHLGFVIQQLLPLVLDEGSFPCILGKVNSIYTCQGEALDSWSQSYHESGHQSFTKETKIHLKKLRQNGKTSSTPKKTNVCWRRWAADCSFI